MEKTRTMAFQISEELFRKIKDYLSRYEAACGRKLTQREFVICLIENALENADEEFEALAAAREDEAVNDNVCGTDPPVSDEDTESEEVPDESEVPAEDATAAQ